MLACCLHVAAAVTPSIHPMPCNCCAPCHLLLWTQGLGPLSRVNSWSGVAKKKNAAQQETNLAGLWLSWPLSVLLIFAAFVHTAAIQELGMIQWQTRSFLNMFDVVMLQETAWSSWSRAPECQGMQWPMSGSLSSS